MSKHTKQDETGQDYAAIKAGFAVEIQAQADTILTNLLPANTLQPEQMHLVKLAIWRTAVSVVGPLMESSCYSATTVERRDLAIHMNNVLIAKAYEVEKVIAAEYVGDDVCITCCQPGRLFPMEDGFPMCAECAGWEDVLL